MTLLLTIILAIAVAFLGTYVHRQNKTINNLEDEISELELHLSNVEDYLHWPVDSGRRKGNTTRLVDKYIQDLFTNDFVEVKDHHDTELMHEYIMKIVLKRLSIEHPHVKIKTHLGFKQITLV